MEVININRNQFEEMVHSHVTQARTGKSCAFRMQGGGKSPMFICSPICILLMKFFMV